EDERLRVCYLTYANLLLEQLRYRMPTADTAKQIGSLNKQPVQTVREYANILQKEMSVEQLDAIHQLVHWMEEAGFNAVNYWENAPTPAQLHVLCKILKQRTKTRDRVNLRTSHLNSD